MTVILEAIGRLAAFALGAWMAYTEATGTYEFYLAEQGAFNYIVKAAVGVTLASVLLPYFTTRAIKGRQWLLAVATLAGLVLSVSVILTAGVHRTSSIADAAKAEALAAKRKLEAAKANVKDAEAALESDKQLVKGECKTGVGKECKKLAGASRETLTTTLELRKAYADTKEPPEDRTAERLSALTGGYISKERIETFQPMLVPVSVSFLAGLLITLALEVEMPGSSHKHAPSPKRPGWGWPAWRRRAEPPLPVVEPAVIDVEPQRVPEPAQKPAPPRVPERSRPRLAAATRQPVGAVLDFLHDAVEIVDGSTRTEMSDAYIGYAAWCRAKSLRPMEAGEFFNEMADHCGQFGIPIQEEAGCVYLGNVRLAA